MPPLAKRVSKVISLDTEDTGVDFKHGAKPYLVTTCDGGPPLFWEWPVNPLTRQPEIPSGDLDEIRAVINAADTIVLQNAKFDCHALDVIGIELPWHKVRDTLLAGHLLATNHPHNLTDMCIEYLGYDINKYEVAVKEATKEARAIAKRDFPEWRLADEGDPMMPSVKGTSSRDEDKPWKNDMWLPRALINHWEHVGVSWGDYVHWLTVTSEYANTDSEVTLPLWTFMEQEIHKRGLWKIYEERLKLLPIAFEMEQRGITVIGANTDLVIEEYGVYVAEANEALVTIAAEFDHELELAEGASINDNMRDFFYGSIKQSCPRCTYEKRIKHWKGEEANGDICPKCAGRKKSPMSHQLVTAENPCLQLHVVLGKNGTPSLDANAMQEYVTTLDEGPALDFINLLQNKRKRETQLSFANGYKRFWMPRPGTPGYYTLYPNLNPVGTDHLRWSSYNPNGQNISKKESECEQCDGEGCEHCDGTGVSMRSMRHCFGPAPGREYWTMDYENIERRIPAYESGEPKMIEVFEKPNEPPYWGSLYGLTASVLYPDEYQSRADVKGLFRKDCPQLYKQAKFFDLAKQYGCGRRKGDLLSRVRNSFDLVNSQFPLLTKLQAYYLSFAERHGYVETLPDRSVDPERGYPILASRTDEGRVLSTTPFNYHVSGSACQAKNRALVRCNNRIKEWNAQGWDGFIALEIHDEILFDMPAGTGAEPWKTNEWRARELAALMRQSGDDIGLPLPVAIEFHQTTWAEGMAI